MGDINIGKRIRAEIDRLSYRQEELLQELGKAIEDGNDAGGRVYIGSGGLDYITEADKSWAADYGYEPGQWMPSAGTC